MEELLYIQELYDYYKTLLTDKQKVYFEEYYFNDLSLSEISENYNVSRNAVSRQLNIVKEKLNEFEGKLKLRNKRIVLEDIIKDIKDKEIIKSIKEII